MERRSFLQTLPAVAAAPLATFAVGGRHTVPVVHCDLPDGRRWLAITDGKFALVDDDRKAYAFPSDADAEAMRALLATHRVTL